jgi:hypothetical protein
VLIVRRSKTTLTAPRRLDIVYDVGDSLSLLIGLRQIKYGFVPERRLAEQAISPADVGPGT